MGGLGISLAGFAGLFSALHPSTGEANPAVYRWRIRNIVMSSIQLTYLGFGAVALYSVTQDVVVTSRLVSFVAAGLWVVDVIRSKPGPAWPDDTDRKWAMTSTLVWATVMAGNVVVGSEGHLQFVMLIFLLGPVLIFIRAVADATRPTEEESLT
ncbi:MAG: hypothetical protein OEM39_01070 [Acidimicrobiia bacterium]|nr:hypothetical protein [Acidimicrobiia bacterium]